MEADGWKIDCKDILIAPSSCVLVPSLWMSLCAERFPSPIALLKGVSTGDIRVNHVLIK